MLVGCINLHCCLGVCSSSFPLFVSVAFCAFHHHHDDDDDDDAATWIDAEAPTAAPAARLFVSRLEAVKRECLLARARSSEADRVEIVGSKRDESERLVYCQVPCACNY